MNKTISTLIANRTKRLFLGRYRHVTLVLLLGVGLTAVVFNTEQNEHQARIQAEFESHAAPYVTAIQKGIERNLEVIESIGGLYTASEKVKRQEFREFVQGPLSRHGDIQALSWNELVKDRDRSTFEAAARNLGLAGFQITDKDAQGRLGTAETRPEYIVVTYIEPYESNQAAMGFDVASNPTRIAALERARDTGKLVTTGRITLVQEADSQYGFLIFKPIYETPSPPETVEGRRQNLEGYAVGVFRIGDMVEAALEDLPSGVVNIQLISGKEAQLAFARSGTAGSIAIAGEQQAAETQDGQTGDHGGNPGSPSGCRSEMTRFPPDRVRDYSVRSVASYPFSRHASIT